MIIHEAGECRERERVSEREICVCVCVCLDVKGRGNSALSLSSLYSFVIHIYIYIFIYSPYVRLCVCLWCTSMHLFLLLLHSSQCHSTSQWRGDSTSFSLQCFHRSLCNHAHREVHLCVCVCCVCVLLPLLPLCRPLLSLYDD